MRYPILVCPTMNKNSLLFQPPTELVIFSTLIRSKKSFTAAKFRKKPEKKNRGRPVKLRLFRTDLIIIRKISSKSLFNRPFDRYATARQIPLRTPPTNQSVCQRQRKERTADWIKRCGRSLAHLRRMRIRWRARAKKKRIREDILYGVGIRNRC